MHLVDGNVQFTWSLDASFFFFRFCLCTTLQFVWVLYAVQWGVLLQFLLV